VNEHSSVQIEDNSADKQGMVLSVIHSFHLSWF